jgi:hypothetical protein
MKIEGYNFGNKNNWRRWVWNRICEKYKRPRGDALIVYLAGAEDLDRRIAIEKGFKPYNLIAVDKDENVVNQLRQKGALAIQGDLFEVLKGFNGTDYQIDILIADICSGVSDEVYSFAKYLTEDINNNIFCGETEEEKAALERGETVDSSSYPVAMFNFMRGRDKGIILNSLKEQTKHRGEMFIRTMFKLKQEYEEREMHSTEPEPFEDYLTYCQPEYKSYKSNCGYLVMDSVVFNIQQPAIIQMKKVSNELTKRISATLAVRTMKMNGRLKHCPVY